MSHRPVAKRAENRAILAQLAEHGFVVIRSAISETTLTQLRDMANQALANDAGGTRHAVIDPPREIADHETPAIAARRVADCEVERISSGLRDPKPGFGQQGLHTDWHPRRSHDEPYVGVTCLWLLDDFALENGATRVVPGSHREGRAIPKRYVQPHAHHEQQVQIEAPAGSLIVFNCHLWHSGMANRSRVTRRVLQEQYVAKHLAGTNAPPGSSS